MRLSEHERRRLKRAYLETSMPGADEIEVIKWRRYPPGADALPLSFATVLKSVYSQWQWRKPGGRRTSARDHILISARYVYEIRRWRMHCCVGEYPKRENVCKRYGLTERYFITGDYANNPLFGLLPKRAGFFDAAKPRGTP